MLLVNIHSFVEGSYNSVLSTVHEPLTPPVTNTLPFVNTDAVCPYRR